MQGASTDASAEKRVSRLSVADVTKLQDLIRSKFGGISEGCMIAIELDYREVGGLSIALEDLRGVIEREKS